MQGMLARMLYTYTQTALQWHLRRLQHAEWSRLSRVWDRQDLCYSNRPRHRYINIQHPVVRVLCVSALLPKRYDGCARVTHQCDPIGRSARVCTKRTRLFAL